MIFDLYKCMIFTADMIIFIDAFLTRIYFHAFRKLRNAHSGKKITLAGCGMLLLQKSIFPQVAEYFLG